MTDDARTILTEHLAAAAGRDPESLAEMVGHLDPRSFEGSDGQLDESLITAYAAVIGPPAPAAPNLDPVRTAFNSSAARPKPDRAADAHNQMRGLELSLRSQELRDQMARRGHPEFREQGR